MGGTSKQEQTSQSKSEQNPWAPTIPGLTSLTNAATAQIGSAGQPSAAQTGALNTLQSNANAGNPYAPQIGVLANDMLGGGTDRTGIAQGGYDQYKAQLDPFARGDYVDPSKNTQLQGYLDTIGRRVQDSVNGQFAGAGRDMSGMNQKAIASGMTDAMAPTLLNAYNAERGNQMTAINSLYGGANQTAGILSGLDQTKLGNQQAGVGMAGEALGANNYGANQTLEIEAQRLGIPLDQLQKIAGILGPIAGLGGTASSSGTQTGTQKMSGAQQFATIAGGIGSMMPKAPMTRGF